MSSPAPAAVVPTVTETTSSVPAASPVSTAKTPTTPTPTATPAATPTAAATAVNGTLDVARFQGQGLSFKGKLIGTENVPERNGEKMCQISMAKLKAVVLAVKEHKRPINVNITLEGLRIIDEKTEEILYTHPVHRISYIFRDTGDSRAFGYIYRKEDDSVHQFFAIKTDKTADAVVISLRELFNAVYQLKKKADESVTSGTTEVKKDEAVTQSNSSSGTEGSKLDETKNPSVPAETPPHSASADLLSMSELTVTQQSSSSQSNAWLLNAFAQPGPTVPPNALPGFHVAGGPGAMMAPPQQGIAMSSPMMQQQVFYAQSQQSMSWQQPPRPFGASYPGTPWPAPALSIPPGQLAAPAVRGQSWPQSSAGDAFHQDPFGGGSSGVAAPSLLQPISTAPPPQIQVQASRPDPFADLAAMAAAVPPRGKKIGKEDFIKEPPKPSLLDLSQNQQTQAQAQASGSVDPFGIGAVSLEPVGLVSSVKAFNSSPISVNVLAPPSVPINPFTNAPLLSPAQQRAAGTATAGIGVPGEGSGVLIAQTPIRTPLAPSPISFTTAHNNSTSQDKFSQSTAWLDNVCTSSVNLHQSQAQNVKVTSAFHSIPALESNVVKGVENESLKVNVSSSVEGNNSKDGKTLVFSLAGRTEGGSVSAPYLPIAPPPPHVPRRTSRDDSTLGGVANSRRPAKGMRDFDAYPSSEGGVLQPVVGNMYNTAWNQSVALPSVWSDQDAPPPPPRPQVWSQSETPLPQLPRPQPSVNPFGSTSGSAATDDPFA